MPFPINRPRRLRRTETIRRMVRETRLSPDDLILPMFVCSGRGVRKAVGSMPGVAQYTIFSEDPAVKKSARGSNSARRVAGCAEG